MSTETTTGTGARPPPDSLLPGELRERIPALYATEDDADPIVHAKLFTPWTTWTWFVTEFDGEDTCFGLVSGHEVELGYFTLGELEAIEGPHGLRIERDLPFTPRPLSQVRAELDRLRGDPDGFSAHEGRRSTSSGHGCLYACPECGSTDVQLCFPVWVAANDIDDKRRWELDAEASPEKDGDKGWCPKCETHVLVVRQRDEPEGPAVRENTEEFNAAAGEGPAHRAPSPLERPGIRVIETRLEPTGLAAEFGTIATPAAAASIFYDLIGEADREHFAVLLLDNKHRITHAHIVSRGTAQTTLVHPREAFKAAVLANAAALIIGHNHPSGNVQPSPEDNAVKDRLDRAGELLGIPVLDSIIVGPTGRFYAANLGGTQTLPRTAAAIPPDANRVAENELTTICRGLMQDIDEVLERQGEDWWDETVTAGTYHRELAERCLGLVPYRPLPDDAEPAGPA